MTHKIDIVIPMDNRSVWNNNELRFTLRSFEQYNKNIGNVFIIGTKPNFIKNVVHLPMRDKSMYPATNIYRKLMHACEQKEISEKFLYANDDHYILPAWGIDKDYYQGDLEDELRSHPDIIYKKVIRNTLEALLNNPVPSIKNFDTHTPLLMSKSVFMQVMANIDWSRTWGYCIKSMYCNYMGFNGNEIQDGKIRVSKPYDYLRDFIKDKVCLSSGNSINEDFKRLLTELYPEKSKYEI